MRLVRCWLLIRVAAALLVSNLWACAVVGRRGDSVAVATESAIIAWDSVHKIQHFIRWAEFDTQASDFGFLVPTPTQPMLKEATLAAFDLLEEWTKPNTVDRQSIRFDSAFMCLGCNLEKSSFKEGNVRILDRQQVGGYDAVVLEAYGSHELAEWLKSNGYAKEPELTAWLEPYVAHQWKIAAFKISRDPKTGATAKASPVRLSFPCDKPYFPYREPARETPHSRDRLLRVFVIGDGRMKGQGPWRGDTIWTDRVQTDSISRLAEQLGLKPEDFSASPWLTKFDDRATPRTGDADILFVPSEDLSVLQPDVIRRHELWIPAESLLGGAFVLFVVVRRYRARKSA